MRTASPGLGSVSGLGGTAVGAVTIAMCSKSSNVATLTNQCRDIVWRVSWHDFNVATSGYQCHDIGLST